MTQLITNILPILTIIAQVAIVGILILLITSRDHLMDHWIGQKLVHHALLLSFLVALFSTLGSLFYSEIKGFDPCKLCWYQRIVMYPQTILLGLALARKEKTIAPYAFSLSIIGALLAGYHYLLQRNLVPSLPCSAVGYSESCSKVFVLSYGYITIPLMAFTGFVLIALLMVVVSRHKKI